MFFLSPLHFIKPTGKAFSGNLIRQPLVHMERLELLRNVCRDTALRDLSHTTVSKFVLDRIFVCDKHKILFCQTPKVGNTQWKKVLIVLNGIYFSVGVWVSWRRRRRKRNCSNWGNKNEFFLHFCTLILNFRFSFITVASSPFKTSP